MVFKVRAYSVILVRYSVLLDLSLIYTCYQIFVRFSPVNLSYDDLVLEPARRTWKRRGKCFLPDTQFDTLWHIETPMKQSLQSRYWIYHPKIFPHGYVIYINYPSNKPSSLGKHRSLSVTRVWFPFSKILHKWKWICILLTDFFYSASLLWSLSMQCHVLIVHYHLWLSSILW